MTNQRISLAMFVISAPVSLAAYAYNEPVNSWAVLMMVIFCAMLCFLSSDIQYSRYERQEMQPPINPDNETEPDWLQEINNLNYEITSSKNHTYAQQLAFDPCPQR